MAVAEAVLTITEVEMVAQAEVLGMVILMVTQLETDQEIEVEITNHIIVVAVVVLTKEVVTNIVTTAVVMVEEVNNAISQVFQNGMQVVAVLQVITILLMLLED